ncbi:ATP-binding protein [Flavobacterium sp. DG1-102-2]|uniref:hybrid sensor histidine kinase/response regulator n=1 Tax=Flavobacterium sp. DG1-102-2 TaxID=3081663 RepID=UPI00294908F3|nr:ATP-binding protein [Flavobacterium sp. DG1-102-2]MDV6168210.1 ATP-binding protein [Flavobacterium sp. DG1-102-2]
MVHKPKAVKYKVIAGYVLLFAIAAFSVWLVYTEISRLAEPSQSSDENKKILNISKTIANLYASEAIGRNSILTGKPNDFKKYSNLIDSISVEVEHIKNSVDQDQAPKFDSIQLLINRKRISIINLIKYRKKYGTYNTYKEGIDDIYNTKDSIASTLKPIIITKRHSWQKAVDAIITPELRDSLTRANVSIDTFAMVYELKLRNLIDKDNKIKLLLFRKEQKLLDENRIISDQLRSILISVEQDFSQKVYHEMRESQSSLRATIENIAWIGAVTLFILIIFAWIIVRDLTINQNYRKKLEVLNHENEELLRTKSMLMATVTHDLQTPLGSIIGFHELLKNSGVTGKQSQYLNNINESANYILKLVNDLLDFSKLENNRISIEKTSFNIKNLIENTCKTLEPMAENKGIELNYDISDELNGNYISDPYRIKQVLTNLISNAIKFTPEGSVEVISKIEDNHIHIAVLDTGIGISREKHGDVFKEFTQAHSGIEKKFGGTGLGLTISKRILELLDGEIILESEEGQGSIFTIVIPCIPSGSNFSDEEETENKETAHLYPALNGKKILIIDDDKMQLALMKELLLNYPVMVRTEINAAAVISLLENETFDIVLTDIQMPTVDGFELVRQIRSSANEVIATLPVIALSGKRNLTATDFTDNGFNGHHPKPVQIEQLLNLISHFFGGETVIIAEIKTEETEEKPLFNLRSLSQFTYNDPESLKTILNTFKDSVTENCIALIKAIKDKDAQQLAEVAHKMIPMLKQMEVHSIVELLVPLEERTYNMDWEVLEDYIDDICNRLDTLCKAFDK